MKNTQYAKPNLIDYRKLNIYDTLFYKKSTKYLDENDMNLLKRSIDTLPYDFIHQLLNNFINEKCVQKKI